MRPLLRLPGWVVSSWSIGSRLQSPAVTGNEAERRLQLLIFTTLLFAYGWFFGGSGFNQNASFNQVRAIVERGQLSINDYASNTGDVSFHRGVVYPNKAPGLSMVAVVPYFLIHALRPGPPHDALALTLDLYLCTVAVCGMAGALIGVLLYRAARRLDASRENAVLLALVAGLGTPLFAYSTMLFAHVPSAALLLIAFLASTGMSDRSHETFDSTPPLVAGAAIGAATAINFLCAPLVLLCGTMLARRNGWRALSLYVAGGLPFALALGAYHYAAFGSPFTTALDTMNPAFVTKGAWMGIFVRPDLDALWGLTFSPFRGLFQIAPILIFAVAGLIMMMRQTKHRAAGAAIIAAVLYFLLANGSFNGWHGGYAIGPRYLVPVIPLLAIPLVFAWQRWKWPVALLAALSLFLNLAATAVDPQPPDTMKNPVWQYSVPALITGSTDDGDVPVWIHTLYTGHTSTNRVAANEALPFQRNPPGSPASEWASFNLGEIIFGPGSVFSLLPFLLMIGALAVFAVKRARALDAAAGDVA